MATIPSRRNRVQLTQDELKQTLSYDPETGVFTWKHRSDVAVQVNGKFAGKPAGSVDHRRGTSYVRIVVNQTRYYAHQLAFLYQDGEIPAEIDHRNGDGTDNRWDNLRACTRQQNMANRGALRTNTLGMKGVVAMATKHGLRYRAEITVNDKGVHLGVFATAKEAHEAHCDAARKHFGEFWHE